MHARRIDMTRPCGELFQRRLSETQHVTKARPPSGQRGARRAARKLPQAGEVFIGRLARRGGRDEEIRDHRIQQKTRGARAEQLEAGGDEPDAKHAAAFGDSRPVGPHRGERATYLRAMSCGRRSSMPATSRACVSEIRTLSLHRSKCDTPPRGYATRVAMFSTGTPCQARRTTMAISNAMRCGRAARSISWQVGASG